MELLNSYHLTKREKTVLTLIIKGYNNPKIGEILHISRHTAKAHISSILKKFNVKTRIQAGVKAIKEDIV